MFISKKHFSRRTFLHGAGVTLALPFLERCSGTNSVGKDRGESKESFGFYIRSDGSIMKQGHRKGGDRL